MKKRPAYSLLELVLATALVGGTLVPALALIRDGLAMSRTTDQRLLLANYAVQKLEEQIPIIAIEDNWSLLPAPPVQGDLSVDGFPLIHYEVTWTDSPTSGGIAGRLMCITSTAYYDEDNDNTLDPGEPRSVVLTKIANVTSYSL